MRSYRTLIISAVVLAALVVPVCTTLAKAPRAVVDAGVLETANLVFPGTKYVNPYTLEAETMGAAGTFVVDQPASKKWVVVWVNVAGLIPNTTYRAYIDQDGIDEAAPSGDASTAGPCQLKGTFTTDASGNGAFYYEALDLAVGTYQWSVYINRIIYSGPKLVVNNTVLISENLNFTIEP